MKNIFFILIFSILSFANSTENEFIKEQKSAFDEQSQSATFIKIDEEAKVLDENINEDTNNLELNTQINYYTELLYDENEETLENTAKNIYLSYKEFPKKIFKNQRFEIVISSIITSKDFDRIETRFLNSENMDVLNPSSPWSEIEDQRFENRYFFKAYNNNFVIPTFQIAIFKDDNLIEFAKIEPENVEFSEIGKNIKSYSSVIAKNLIINAHKTKQYNNDELITIIDLSGVESNLEDFYIKGVEEQGVSSIEDNYPNQNLLYYLVLPVHTKKLEFTYYDNNQKKYVPVKLPIILENELVSTQTDLNPNKSNLLFYKKVALGVLFLLLLVSYLWKKKKLYLYLSIISFLVLVYYVVPNETKILKKGSYIYILPTNKSTIFQQTAQNHVVEVSIKRGEFIKVIFNQNGNNLIGWVKENDFVKN